MPDQQTPPPGNDARRDDLVFGAEQPPTGPDSSAADETSAGGTGSDGGSDDAVVLTDSAEAEPRRTPGWRWPAIVAAAVLVLMAGAYAVDLFLSSGQLERGTTIAGVDVGGRTPDEAAEVLERSLADLTAPIAVVAHGAEVGIDPAAAGLGIDIEASVAAAGTRSANPFTRVAVLFGSERTHPLIATVDETALTGALQSIAAASDVAPVEGSVALAGTEVQVVDPVIGQHLSIPDAVTVVRGAWLSGDPRSLAGAVLPVSQEPVRASVEGVRTAAAEAQAVLSGPLTVVTGDTSFVVPVEALAPAVGISPDDADGFTVTVDEAALLAALAPQWAATETAPADASVAIVDGAPVITPGVDGRVVDAAATAAALSPALRSPEHTLTVVYTITPPARTTETVQAWGIVEVVSEYTTGGFASDSGQNVKRVAEEVQGAILLPGETFSLNGYTGPRTAAEGYVEAGIIQDGVPGRAVGGGISQFATTIFNASYFAGMEDVEHQNHSYYISRYPAGREATVFQNPDGSSVIDVKFRNPYDTAVLIETVWTPSDITVRFWGTKTVEVESISGDRYNFTSPPQKTIPYGQTCRASNGTSGFSIDVTRVIRDLAGNELSRDTTTTVYNGQAKIICAPAPQPPTDPEGG